MNTLNFHASFFALTSHEPLPWQHKMYSSMLAGDFSSLKRCSIPTGLGKTSVMPIWLIALANAPGTSPRRLVYVVNRRTVVDQATREAEDIRKRLLKPEEYAEHESLLSEIRLALRQLSADSEGSPLAISTLRGQFADNREWSADPSRPAIIVGTVDMIGSRLLFSGYGAGFKLKPHDAGFLGQDVLLVHDEAHLEPAFQKLLLAIRSQQTDCNEFGQFHVMELSATSRGGDAFVLTDEDRSHPVVMKRIHAKKAIHLHENDDEKKLPDELAELALAHKESRRAVLVFARRVEVVEKVAERLRKAKLQDQVEMLTGTLRGKERDELVAKPIFRRFLPGAEKAGETVYLVCTSAGEVGVNISADHLVCDLSTFESMAQRFGRVNRFGEETDTRIDVVSPRKLDENDPLSKTLGLLRTLHGDGSPDALGRLDPDERLAAFSPPPETLETSGILFDAWALTTVRDKLPGRPPVEPYLHGMSEWEPPETHVAWREEVDSKHKLWGRYKAEDLLEDYPLKPHELLRDRSDRVFKHLAAIADRHPEQDAWLLDEGGKVERVLLKELADKDRKERINSRTILLPPSVGGLQNGLFDGKSDEADDVADQWFGEKGEPRRMRNYNEKLPPGMRRVCVLDKNPNAEEERESKDESEDEGKDRFWYWFVKSRSADDDGSMTSRSPVTWDDHTGAVTENLKQILKNLPVSEDLKHALVVAAMFHDLGKMRLIWQRSIGNLNPGDRDPAKWLAKSGGTMKTIGLTDYRYRHEFGSLIDLEGKPEFENLSDDLKELVRHLIAAHHGRARPHFPPEEIFDHEPNGKDVDALAAQVPRRFARLQRKYGRWGLAYLESLLRAADHAASAKEDKA